MKILVMRKAIDDRDGESLQHAAHTLRVASGNLGAMAMRVSCAELEEAGAASTSADTWTRRRRASCAELEEAGAASTWDDAIPALQRLSAAYELTSEALRRISNR